MGNVEDVRKVVQDFVVPDLKALVVRLETLEKEMKMRFDHVDERFSSMEKLMVARHEALMATIAANYASIMNTWEMEKRLTRLEYERTKVVEAA